VIRTLLRIALALAVVSTGLLAPVSGSTPGGYAQAADLRYFDAGNIISDAVFFDSRSMTASDVQRFLDTKGAKCVAGEMPCMKDYRQDTVDQAGDAYCTTYRGAQQESAASIIAKVAAACGISPRVLLVLLQKEQSLVSRTKPTTYAYTKATGFGCPDTAACDPAFSGFVSQVYFAARQFQRYAAGVAGSYRAGRENTILFNPNRSCGSSKVYIANKATAGLYSYTPYQPNRAALDAGYGTGDKCSAYGNRNFWNYFTDWFGSTQSRGGSAIHEKYIATGGSGGPLGAASSGINCGLVGGGCFQHFQNASIYWSPGTGAHVVSDSVRARWSELRWELGPLGYPTMDTWCGLTGGACFQTFQGGSLYATSRTAKAWMVRGAIRDAWATTGWETGTLGFPTSDENCGLVRGGCFNTFQNGAIYYSPSTGARPVSGALLQGYAARKWERGVLGYPVAAPRCGLRAGGCVQRFQGATLYASPASGASWVRGGISEAYAVAGNEAGVLGYPIQDERCGLVGSGCYSKFENGSIYWSPATGAQPVLATMRAKWAALGGERGMLGYPVQAQKCGLPDGGCAQRFQGAWLYTSPVTGTWFVRGGIRDAWNASGAQDGRLGYPTSDEYCGLRGGWCFQHFAGGSIYWGPTVGARIVLQPIREGWAALRWELGPLGYPTADTRCGWVDGGCYQHFAGGSLFWSQASGVHMVRGAMRDRWKATGWAAGPLGYPTSDEYCGLAKGGCFQVFQKGSLYWTPTTGAHAVAGQIRDAWAAQGYETGRLGYPVEEARRVANGTAQRFQGGTVTYDSATRTVTVR
jgi:uncharacterized protein with LGFP repeats